MFRFNETLNSILFLCTKTALGDIILYTHLKHAVSEMAALEIGWNRLMQKSSILQNLSSSI